MKLKLSGRILFLAADPAAVRAQLGGKKATLATVGPLRDDISTDEITPIVSLVHYDETLGEHPYTGFKAGDERPIGHRAVLDGGFAVTVAGRRYGKGSSREHSPAAELAAGIRLIVAESFERIYRQNADNLGLLTSTDFGLLERIERDEEIDVAELVAGRDTLAATILRSGGLLRYGHERLGATANGDVIEQPAAEGPLTLFEKIVRRHVVATPDTSVPTADAGGFVRADFRFIHEYYTGMCSHLLHKTFGRPAPLHERESIVCFEDHLSYVDRSPAHVAGGLIPSARRLSTAHREFVADYGLRDHGYLQGRAGSEGISHAMMAESYALPGQLIVGTDSHTPHSGALGCVAFGVGTTDMANAMVTGAVRMVMPEVLRIELEGSIPRGVTAKDVILHLLALPSLKGGLGVGRVFEFAGPGMAGLSTDERATLTNMTAELGGFTGIVEPDAETVRFLRERRGVEFAIEPWMRSDDGARYSEVIRIDCSAIPPMVAAPGDPGNGRPLAEIEQRVTFEIAYGGSCTAGKREDFDRYHEVLAWADANGLRVAPHVTLFLQFGTSAVRDYCEERGYVDTFRRVGAELLEPSCGACANCGPGSSTRGDQVTVSAINRNFPGRSGPGQVWLASPPTVAASAIAGTLVSFDELRNQQPR